MDGADFCRFVDLVSNLKTSILSQSVGLHMRLDADHAIKEHHVLSNDQALKVRLEMGRPRSSDIECQDLFYRGVAVHIISIFTAIEGFKISFLWSSNKIILLCRGINRLSHDLNHHRWYEISSCSTLRQFYGDIVHMCKDSISAAFPTLPIRKEVGHPAIFKGLPANGGSLPPLVMRCCCFMVLLVPSVPHQLHSPNHFSYSEES